MDNENKRIDIEDLPRAEEELTDEEATGVTGGAGATAGILYGAFHGNDAGDAVINRVNLTSGNTVGGSLAGDVSNPVKP